MSVICNLNTSSPLAAACSHYADSGMAAMDFSMNYNVLVSV